ncbi:methionine aminopeptidase, type I [Desulfatibacillum alkenivorans DSM 16219]|jgi:methionyl aminopeptidase|uniref:Methionine aminopeptidase n=1 Tax=Desulfatibacillum alkenivorans DSM 16219 TaxID=1121393 RepID=A0A1M6WE94_9BACT|nr:type I methionyl aminopeptidase [Desulfatibacillum alkenivorans]SHK92133.1 methionine aminopeptidase, type I [Desulfatibacillum alkenivorans DSM 16219]
MLVLKSRREIELIRNANQIVGTVLKKLASMVKPGVSTLELDALARKMCKDFDCKPAFLGYRGFPFALCASVNEQVVHGFPSDKPLQEGDILSMDFGVRKEGYFGDSAVTVAVGSISRDAQQLMDVTEQSLYAGIDQARPGNRVSDISAAVQECVEAAGFSVVRSFVGHGIGKELHEEPQVPNFGAPGRGPRLKAGMTIAIEPMVNAGRYEVDVLDDGWTAVTRDGTLSAHFEHTIAILEDGPVILSAVDGSE